MRELRPAVGTTAGSGPHTAERPAASSGRASAGAATAPQDPLTAAQEICLRQLSMGPRTKAQLTAALARRGVDEEVAEKVLGRLSEVGLVDDAAFAAAWVETRHAGRGLAKRALAHELRRRGVADPLVEGAVAELDGDRELATARDIAARRLRASRGLDAPVRFRRAAGALARKGYSEAVAYRVIREALEAEGATAGLDDVLPDFPDLSDDLD